MTTNPLPLDAAARAALRAKAEAARTTWLRDERFDVDWLKTWLPDELAEFFAAVSPDVILALLAAVERGAEDTARLTEEVRELRSAGGMLSNCAFNLSQWPTLDPRTAETLNATYRNWDRVVERHVQRAATPTGADDAHFARIMEALETAQTDPENPNG